MLMNPEAVFFFMTWFQNTSVLRWWILIRTP